MGAIKWTANRWQKHQEAAEMLGFLCRMNPVGSHGWVSRPRVSNRKFRLFACGWCRTINVGARSEQCKLAVDAAKRFAEGFITPEELAKVHKPFHDSPSRLWRQDSTPIEDRYAY